MVDDAAERLRAEGLDPHAWSSVPGDVYAPHRHAFDKVLVVARGSITFELRGSGTADILMHSGDRLDLPANTLHAARVHDLGVTCLEAHCPAGSVEGPRVRRWPGW